MSPESTTVGTGIQEYRNFRTVPTDFRVVARRRGGWLCVS